MRFILQAAVRIVGLLYICVTSANAGELTQVTPTRAEMWAKMDPVEAAKEEQLKTIRQDTPDPAAQVAKVAAWLAGHPELKHKPAVFSNLNFQAPPRTLTGDAALQQEIFDGLRETRALSLNPEQKRKLAEEFLRLNATTIESLKPRTSTDPGVLKQMMSTHIQSRLTVSPDDINAQLAQALSEIRKKTIPQEQVRLVAELLRLNKDLIEDTRNPKLPTQPLEK